MFNKFGDGFTAHLKVSSDNAGTDIHWEKTHFLHKGAAFQKRGRQRPVTGQREEKLSSISRCWSVATLMLKGSGYRTGK